MVLNYDDLLNKKFAPDGKGPDYYNCYEFLRECGKRINMNLPEFDSPTEDSLIHQIIISNKTLCEELSYPTPYCLVLFTIRGQYVTHIGMMIDNNRFIHIMEKSGVTVENINRLEWKKRIKGFYKWIQEKN